MYPRTEKKGKIKLTPTITQQNLNSIRIWRTTYNYTIHSNSINIDFVFFLSNKTIESKQSQSY